MNNDLINPIQSPPKLSRLILENTISPLFTGIVAACVFTEAQIINTTNYAFSKLPASLSNRLSFGLFTFIIAFLDFPIYTVCSFVVARLTNLVVRGKKTSLLEQSEAYARRNIPVIADITIGLIAIIENNKPDPFNLAGGLPVIAAFVTYAVLPIGSLRNSYGFRFFPSLVVEILSFILFFFGTSLLIVILATIWQLSAGIYFPLPGFPLG